MRPEEKLAIVLEGEQEDTTVKEVCERHGISRDTYYRWKKEHQQSSLDFWAEQKPGRKGQDDFHSKSEAKAAYEKQRSIVEEQNTKITELEKVNEALNIQLDFAEYRLQLDQNLNTKNGFTAEERAWILERRNNLNLVRQEEFAELVNCSVSVLYRWAERAENGSLEDEDRTPNHFPQATPVEAVKEALEAYFLFPNWGGQNISNYLWNNEIVYMSSGTAQKIKNKILKELEDKDYEFDMITRYEALQPNDMWAIDFIQFNWYGQTLYIAILLDDHSRYILNWRISTSPTTQLVIDMIDDACSQYEKPIVLKSDNGPQFRKQCTHELNNRGIFHLLSPTYYPQFNGKVERVNKDIKEIVRGISDLDIESISVGIEQLVHDHNFVQPHQALGGITPHQRFSGQEHEVKREMEAFRQRDLSRRGFDAAARSEVKSPPEGITVPIQRDGRTILRVRMYHEIFFEDLLD